jgi:aspartyl-tRNA(Asn)/glutamyl-tRNA(Gln) amidotransferase subunit A
VTDLASLSIEEIGRGLRTSSFSCVEIVQCALARIDVTQSVLNAFAHVDPFSPITEAKRLDSELRSGRDRGPLHGVPVAIKDVIAVAGTPSHAGSTAYRSTPRADAWIVRTLRKAGAVVVGLTRLHEVALGATGLNPHDGGARNPRALGRIAGGSSSGSAVAVAAGLVPLAVGTDTGGSVRIPAALCGAVGIKPTYGLIHTDGVMPLAPTLDHVGLIARSVTDIELALRAIGAISRCDASTLRGLRVGILSGLSSDLAAPVEIAYKAFLRILREHGARLSELKLCSVESVLEMSTTILLYEAFRTHELAFRSRPTAFGSDVRQRLTEGQNISKAGYLSALRGMNQLRKRADTALKTYPMIVCPTVAVQALPIEETQEPTRRGLLPRNTRLFNLLGSPAISIPAPNRGLPIGLQLAAARGRDGTLLSIAQVIEGSLSSESRIAHVSP